jgi:hypothetical protein
MLEFEHICGRKGRIILGEVYEKVLQSGFDSLTCIEEESMSWHSLENLFALYIQSHLAYIEGNACRYVR